MNSWLNILEILLPFFAGLAAVFLSPILAKYFRREYDQVERDANRSDILSNYSEALEKAWRRIEEQEEELRLMKATHTEQLQGLRNTERRLLRENGELKGTDHSH